MSELSPELDALRVRFAEGRAALEQRLPAAGRDVPVEGAGLALGRAHAGLLDGLLAGLFPLTLGGRFPGVVLAGVGSYGRGAVALRSDLDVRLLAPSPTEASRAADALLYPLWDMGLSIGHQVVGASELVEGARSDLPTATSLLDFRFVAGDHAAAEGLRRRAASGPFAPSELPRFMRRLEDEVSGRHARFGGSVYLLEPDVKNGPGALRDLDIARWAAEARYGSGELDVLVRLGALVPREAAEIAGAAEMLWRIRNLLHAHAGRRSDRLTFDEQDLIAPLLGFGEGGEGVERMMSAYYRAARTIARARDMTIARATPHLSRKKPQIEELGDGVRIFDGAITLRDASALGVEPALALRVVSAAVERGLPLLPFARDVLARAAADPGFAAELRADAEAQRRFVELVTTVRETRLRAGSVLRELHDLGLLLAMIPEFSPVVGRVHHDTYHVYTVDVHSVAAVDHLAALVRGELSDAFPLASRLAAEITRPAMLFFATLLHDVGKAIGGKDHSQRGADMAAAILTRLGFPADDVTAACHLIQKHLLMYHVATRRDLDDPAAVSEFTREVRGREGLRDLYLLTVADLSTTSPTSMTSWKARMLDELLIQADRALRGSRDDDGRVARVVAEAEQVALALPSRSPEQRAARATFLRGFLASMPVRYLLSNPSAALAAHAHVAFSRHERGVDAPLVTVDLVPSRHPGAAELCFVAADRPGLLAAITAALAASRLEVFGAQIHSRPLDAAGAAMEALDLFWVRDRGEGEGAVTRAIPKLVADIDAALSGRVDAAELALRRGASPLRDRGPAASRASVTLDDRASPTHTVIEVATRDRPGLLFAIADVLHRLGLSVGVAKINTEGTRVADVFYVTETDGTKVAAGPRSAAIRERLLAVVA
jgi:[protein-PII] uridylyltransferase